MSLSEKWEKETHPIQPVRNEDLTCRTCKSRIPNMVVNCGTFRVKPLSVLKGGVCSEYKKEE